MWQTRAKYSELEEVLSTPATHVFEYPYLHIDEALSAASKASIWSRSECTGREYVDLAFASHREFMEIKLRWHGLKLQTQQAPAHPTNHPVMRISGIIPFEVQEWLDEHCPDAHLWLGPTIMIFQSHEDREAFEAAL